MRPMGAAARLSSAPSGRTTAVCRSRLYAFFAEALAYPDDALSDRLRDGALDRTVREAAAGLAAPLALPAPLAGLAGAANDLQIEYTALFYACGTRPAVSMLEHRQAAPGEPAQPVWEDLLRCYRHFGLDFTRGALTDSPDHLLIELDFMHYLAFLEAGAKQGQDDLRRGQRDFLARHPARWMAAFSTAVSRHAAGGFHAAVAALLHAFVSADLAYLNGVLAPRTA